MDAFELLKDWPGWSRANAGKILSSPAWRMELDYDGAPAVLRRREDRLENLVWLDVAFDDESVRLGIADSESFPDLHRLWAKREGLPREVLLALVERECGALFQALEDALRKGLSVTGLAEAPADDAKAESFTLERPDGDGSVADFTLGLTPALLMPLGQLRFLDTDHPAVRGLEREAEAEYAEVALEGDEAARLAAGDYVLLPQEAAATWRTGRAASGAYRLVGAATGTVTFGQIVDDDLPPVPPPEDLRLVKGTEVVAEGRFAQLLGVPAMEVVKTAGKGGV